mmetsp:Transcript_619/g.2210  ORF Transcript_619/g.2210 Transcript_619/m.2210 type:complete len:249 (+) Transcript_619:449-1195(+)
MRRWWITQRRSAPLRGRGACARTGSRGWKCTRQCCGTSRRRWSSRTWRRRRLPWIGSRRRRGASWGTASRSKRSMRRRCASFLARYRWIQTLRTRTPSAGTSTLRTRISKRGSGATGPLSASTRVITTRGTGSGQSTFVRRSTTSASTTFGERSRLICVAACSTATSGWRCTRSSATVRRSCSSRRRSGRIRATPSPSSSAPPSSCPANAFRRHWSSSNPCRRWRRGRRPSFSSWAASTRSCSSQTGP